MGVVTERWCPTQQMLGVFLRRILVKKFLLVICAVLIVTPALAQEKRSSSAVRQFEKQNPPPGPRSEYRVDHIDPLANGGTNAQSNLQWQTKEDARKKDNVECGGQKCGHR